MRELVHIDTPTTSLHNLRKFLLQTMMIRRNVTTFIDFIDWEWMTGV